MVMTTKELKDQQRHIGASGRQMAEWLGITPEHYSRLRNGERQITKQTAGLVSALATGWRP